MSIMPMTARRAKPRRSAMPQPRPVSSRALGAGSAPVAAGRPGSNAPKATAPQMANTPYAPALVCHPYAAAPAATAAGATTLPRSPVKL